MRSSRIPLGGALLLGSALVLASLTPAIGANVSRDDLKRTLAAQGIHPSVLPKTANAHVRSQADPTYTVLHTFAGPANDGASPDSNVTMDDVGNIYGTTNYGGTANFGTLFKLAPDGTQTLLHSFGVGSDGSTPDGKPHLVRSTGDIYGTTESGGTSGNGVIWKLASDGTYSVLYNFGANDGFFSRGRLILDTVGNFYGTALFGGASSDGTVYKYGFDGTFTILHAFNGTDGEFPEHGVVRDTAGNLYGVTAFGGTSDEGTVYKIASDGTFSTLYNFTGGADGGFLYGGLAIDKDGNLYGSTGAGGSDDQGTVFKLAPDGTLTTLYNFTGGTDGGSPEGDMMRMGQHLYSTASMGGDPSCNCGVVYEIDIGTGKETVLHAFTGPDGSGYSGGLVNKHGVLYGTTEFGGNASGYGVVFSVTKK